MVTSAVLGAAAGTGLALVVAMTMVIYRYYLRRRSKDWGDLERFGEGRYSWFTAGPVSRQHETRSKSYGSGHRKGPLYAMPQQDFYVDKEQHVVQPLQQSGYSSLPEVISPCSDSPPSPTSGMLTHQSRSLPSGPGSGNGSNTGSSARLLRTPSVSSQSSIESVARQGHRGSSPAIRTFSPEGRSTDFVSSLPTIPSRGSLTGTRSPSPLRAASLDVRGTMASFLSGSPMGTPPPGPPSQYGCAGGDLRTPSPSQTSLTSLTERSSCASPSHPATRPRCLSPLLIPPKSPTLSDSSISPGASGLPPCPVSPIGALQLDLYQRKDTTVFLGCPPHSPPLGRLHYRVTFDIDKSDLHVHLIEAHDLAGSDQGGFNDPYVKLSLVPEVDTRKRQTAIHRNDPNPFFDEHFKFPISHEELREKVLILQVFDYDRYSRNDVVGEVRMQMEDFDITANVEVWGEITKNKKPPGERQEVLFSLSYLPSAERLTVVLLKARNLFLPSNKDSIDPFAKVYLAVGGKRLKKKKTSARKGTINPVWNEAFSFNVPSSSISQASIEVCVVDQSNDLMGNNALIGTCIVGEQERGAEGDHWNDMTQNMRKAVAMWHTLR